MFQLGLIETIQAEREREIERAIRRRRLLKPQDEATEPFDGVTRRMTEGRLLGIRVRLTGG